MSEKSIYDLKLHERIHICGDLEVVKVPGGFMYIRIGYQTAMAICFVPYESIAHTGPR